MVEVTVFGNDLDRAWRELQKKIHKDGILVAISRRLEPNPSVRRRNKRRTALRRLKKNQKRQSQPGTRGADTDINYEYRFVRTDGEYEKVPVKKGGLHQIGIV